MKTPKSGQRWDDRVAITIMIGTWLALGVAGACIQGGGYVAFLLG